MLGGIYHQVTGQEWVSQYSHGWLLAHYLAFEPSRRGQVTRYVEPDPDRHAGARRREAGLRRPQAAREGASTISQPRHSTDADYPGRDDQGRSRRSPCSSPDDEAGARAVAYQAGGTRQTGHRAQGCRLGAIRDGRSSHAAPSSLELLAEAEFQAKRLCRSVAAADQALAIDPNAFKALIYKGRAQLELAKKDPTIGGLDRNPPLVPKANRLDAEIAGAADVLLRDLRRAGRYAADRRRSTG